MFLHDYHVAYEISIVRTLALKLKVTTSQVISQCCTLESGVPETTLNSAATLVCHAIQTWGKPVNLLRLKGKENPWINRVL